MKHYIRIIVVAPSEEAYVPEALYTTYGRMYISVV